MKVYEVVLHLDEQWLYTLEEWLNVPEIFEGEVLKVISIEEITWEDN
jgi:hypothetical protein